ncbi:MAG: hypothetical protein QXU74_02905 [Candidatus Aenigmatarchaeota archaeon]
MKELGKSFEYVFWGDIYLFCEKCGRTTVIGKDRRKELGIKSADHDSLKFLRCDCGAAYGGNFYKIDPLKE